MCRHNYLAAIQILMNINVLTSCVKSCQEFQSFVLCLIPHLPPFRL